MQSNRSAASAVR